MIRQLSRRAMLRYALPVLAISWAAFPPRSVQAASTLFYGGDYDQNDADTNETNVPINIAGKYALETALVYNSFTVPSGQTWTVSSVFSNNQIAYSATPTNATWQIRQGMSAQNGGTTVASGDTAATETLKTAADYNTYVDPEYTISATVPSVVLAPGTYWLAVSPDSRGYYGDQSYIETTSGAGSIGVSSSTTTQYVFVGFSNSATTGAENFVATNLDFSAGVVGTSATPEPAAGLGTALAGGLFLIRRSWRNRRRTPPPA